MSRNIFPRTMWYDIFQIRDVEKYVSTTCVLSREVEPEIAMAWIAMTEEVPSYLCLRIQITKIPIPDITRGHPGGSDSKQKLTSYDLAPLSAVIASYQTRLIVGNSLNVLGRSFFFKTCSTSYDVFNLSLLFFFSTFSEPESQWMTAWVKFSSPFSGSGQHFWPDFDSASLDIFVGSVWLYLLFRFTQTLACDKS